MGPSSRAGLSFGVILAAAAPAVAQQDAADARALEEVVVTAQKRSERIIDVPLSIAAVSGEALGALGVATSRDIQQVVPGVVNTNNGLSYQPAIRGVTSTGTSAGDETNVATYLDDVYIGSSNSGVMELVDIERVEVLKGPQGTLFGRNATGGAIRIVTRDPQFVPEAKLSAAYGFEFHQRQLSAYVTGPITETVAASLTGYYDEDDGYVRNIVTGNDVARDVASIRGKLLFKPTENFKAVLSARFFDGDDPAAYALVPYQGNNQNYVDPTVVRPTQIPGQIASSVDPIMHVEITGAQLNAEWSWADVEVRSITGYTATDGEWGFDSDRTSLPITSGHLLTSQDTLSQELNFAGPADARLSWVAGLFYYHSDATLLNSNHVGNFSDPLPVIVQEFDSQVITESYAGYGELTFHVTDALKLIGGIRQTTEEKEFNFRDVIRAQGLRTEHDSTRWDSTNYRAVVQYEFATDANVYASINTGFKSGVYNANLLPINLVDPEEITAYEIGAKARIGDVTLSAAVFHYDYEDIQVQSRDIDASGVLRVQLFNAADARIQGVELNASGPLARGLSIYGGISWMPTAEYRNFPNAQVFVRPTPESLGNTVIVPFDASDSQMIRAPELTANLGVTYEAVVASGLLRASANAYYNDGFYWQPGDLGPEPSYTLVNSSVGWTTPNERVTVAVFGENILDEQYGIYRPFGTNGTAQAWGRTREFGVRIDFSF